ncbi:LCP family protein [Rugosimonospora africana]|uniref:Cell envelope-related transcriptional attenuator domain-containing protein n=1 Tax=Rugosimonospora africana TaxID=556532 RepID=A0A8J3R2Y8_9ACTN|nr:LCP family protein [Rugosimonospora africana]GIH20582.1 hypothetical protein Raf01_87540 [Rugosimonospora africana]
MQYASRTVQERSGERFAADQRGGPSRPTRTKRRGKRKSPLWARLLVIFGAVLMVGSTATIVGMRVLVAAATSSVTQQDLLGSGGTHGKHASINGAKNILLVGVDTRVGNSAMGSRSDSIIILHVPAGHDQGDLVSIPRDTWVSIPAYDNGKQKYAGGHDKINAAFEFGSRGLTGPAAGKHGFELLEKTIQGLPGMSGLTFDAGAIVDFSGFTDVVNALGGVTLCVDEKTTSIHVGFTKSGREAEPYYFKDGVPTSRVPGVTPVVYNPGCQYMVGWRALDYVRQRDKLANGDGDYGRQRHQQQFVKALASKIMSGETLTNYSKLTKVLNTVGKAMTIDPGNFSIEDWIFAMKGIGGNGLITIKTNDGNYSTDYVNGQSIQTLNPTSMQLLESVKDDTVDSFIAAHTDWVAKS